MFAAQIGRECVCVVGAKHAAHPAIVERAIHQFELFPVVEIELIDRVGEPGLGKREAWRLPGENLLHLRGCELFRTRGLGARIVDRYPLAGADAPGLSAANALDERDLLALHGGPGEAAVDPLHLDVIGPHTFRFVSFGPNATGELDLRGNSAALADTDRVSVYAFARLWVPSDRAVRLQFGSDDGLQAFLDGVELARNATPRGYAVASHAVDVNLTAGPHRLLLKLTNLSGNFAFGARVVDPASGVPFPDLFVDLGRGVTRASCTSGTRACGPNGWAACAGAIDGLPESCNGQDDDCDGVVPRPEEDRDGDALAPCEGDCDDTRAAALPGATEWCNGRDDDCDGAGDTGMDQGGADPGSCAGVQADCTSGQGLVCPGGTPGRCIELHGCLSDADCSNANGPGWRCAGLIACVLCSPP